MLLYVPVFRELIGDTMPQGSQAAHTSSDLYALTAVTKGFPIFCTVLLPVLYAQHLIDASTLGYIGAFFIACKPRGQTK